ncbi:MAG: exosome non-catalytic core subunit rrp4 [Trichoglossum hirsutum]|nr:MAG: exosome non-catalytic core subunit rrp4 [Trichoglossum hirsutum]
MAITITTPAPVATADYAFEDSSSEGEDDHHAAKSSEIVTPGETITEDAQWMRGHGTYAGVDGVGIVASVAGTVSTTNKLLSVRAVRARYTPEIGDLVQTSRYTVQISAPLLASLHLSAINLPGGVLRKRTTTDELHIRSYFAEGDLVVAEVQTLHHDGSAALHTRSLRYGKLRNGVFVPVAGRVARGRRQVFALGGSAGDLVDVYLGVNGYVFVAQRATAATAHADASAVPITRLEDSTPTTTYSSQNDPIPPATRREIARVAGCVRALAEAGIRVDEDRVRRAYEASLEDDDAAEWGVEGGYLGGERGRRVVKRAVEFA